jgi:hypothetical protein
VIISDGVGGAVITWQDQRGGNWDVYAQRVSAGGMPTLVMFASAVATVDGGSITLTWRMAEDVAVSGFHIERSDAADGSFVSIDLLISQTSGTSFSSVDRSVDTGRTYWYRIVLAGPSGEESYGPIEARVCAVPTAYWAYQSYPNPFNPVCTIRYDIPSPGRVKLQVFDVSGSLMRSVVNGWREPGVYSEVWDGRDAAGKQLPSGVYFYRLEAGDFVATRKMVLLR